ncbi:leucyl/phenylalanyl-tRNA--protein transferase [Bizionia paragorgiae]|uniref:Leucyl/phenylalanyl-tRNA--protein transferase n=1 Tax=Bizionia paragorgiae TaxID=283786 RepID=A0A1H4BEZ0_BIZPA|nr:leucyl/phenylalanyl-tRNA--protein transferase [Bizionia paragorgiae]SEA46667.1 leucyl/phenylalanyl-tRNA--protein transferase [Bizionia paragorgiae]
MYFLEPNDAFPDVALADDEGLLAFGGELTTQRLLDAYSKGIFPWFEDDQPVLWWSPDPRFVLYPSELKVSKSMKQFMRNCALEVTVNRDFRAVITECALAKRDGQAGTWITSDMIEAYVRLHELGYAKSVEVYNGDLLVGGLYGVDLGRGVFCGESMFSKQSNASKAAFISFIQNTNYKLIDCQVYTNHLASLGAKDIPRDLFLSYL